MKNEWVIELIIKELKDSRIQPFRGKIPSGLGRSKPEAIIFKTKCHCGVSAILTVDIPVDSTEEKIIEMIPYLAEMLNQQATQFLRYKCDVHARMSIL